MSLRRLRDHEAAEEAARAAFYAANPNWEPPVIDPAAFRYPQRRGDDRRNRKEN